MGQIIIYLFLFTLGIYLFTKKSEAQDEQGNTVIKHNYRIMGIVLIVLVLLGALSPFLSDGSIN